MSSPTVPPGTAPEVASLAVWIRGEIPRFRLLAKESSLLMRVLHLLVRWFNPRFLAAYTTTIGHRVYMPASVRADPEGGTAVLRHERVHVEQFRRHPAWFPVSYLLVPPVGVTMRARWELEAYTETMRVELERTGDVSDRTIVNLVEVFAGPAYLYMDVRRGLVQSRLEAIRDELRAQR